MANVEELVFELESYISDFKLWNEQVIANGKKLSSKQVVSLLSNFQEKFPKGKLGDIAFEDYVLGTKRKVNSYSYWLEFKSAKLGSIAGGSVTKHGIWLSKEGNFQTTKRFSAPTKEASMDIMRNVLSDLIENGARRDFFAIDAIDAADTLKYKTIYMYYPDLYIPIFSNMHYTHLIKELGYIPEQYRGLGSKQQLLVEIKEKSLKLNKLTMYEYARFLYPIFVLYMWIPKTKKR